MNTKTEPAPMSGLDRAKLASAITLAAAAMGGFYYFAGQVSLLFRVLGLLGATVAAALIALQSEPGRQFAGFIKEAQVETRKVVWPTRQETSTTSWIIFMVVLVTGVGLWLLDLILNKAIKAVIGG